MSKIKNIFFSITKKLVLSLAFFSILMIIGLVIIITDFSDHISIHPMILQIIGASVLIIATFANILQIWDFARKDMLRNGIEEIKRHLKTLDELEKQLVYRKTESQAQVDLTKEQRDLCDQRLRNMVEILTDIIPEKLPGIELGYPTKLLEEVPSKIIQQITQHIEKIDPLSPEENPSSICFNIENDWLSQRYWFLAGNFWYFIKKYDKALTHYQYIEEISPVVNEKTQKLAFRKEILLFNHGTSLGNLKRFEEAQVKYERATQLDPNFAHAFSNWGVTLGELKRFEEALTKYEKAIQRNQSLGETFSNWGIALVELKRFEEALTKFEQATQLYPNFANAFFNWGIALSKLSRHEEALAKYERAALLDPNDAEAFYNRGVALSKLRCYEEALAKYERAIQLDPNLFNAFFNWGVALGELRRYKEALTKYEQATQLDPNFANAFFNWGVALSKLRRYKEALAKYERAALLDPNDVEIFYNWGIALGQLRRYEEAIVIYTKALEIDSDEAIVWYNIACYSSILRQVDQSLDYLSQAIDLDSKYREEAQKDPDFNNIKSNPRFLELIKNDDDDKAR